MGEKWKQSYLFSKSIKVLTHPELADLPMSKRIKQTVYKQTQEKQSRER